MFTSFLYGLVPWLCFLPVLGTHILLSYLNVFAFLIVYFRKERPQDLMDCIIDLREYDVPYHVRFAIDNGRFYVYVLFFVCRNCIILYDP